jgi:Fur family ferric uptake transcriptional regulator
MENTASTIMDIEAILKNNKIKNTRQRQCVLEFLSTCKQPVTAEFIYQSLYKEMGEAALNMSTVYRVLDIMVKHKIINKINLLNDNKATYEFNRREHKHHLVCIKCNLVTPISGCPLKGYEQALTQSTHYEILEHKLEIFGVCPNCQKKN